VINTLIGSHSTVIVYKLHTLECRKYSQTKSLGYSIWGKMCSYPKMHLCTINVIWKYLKNIKLTK